jgi:hypothetical protein
LFVDIEFRCIQMAVRIYHILTLKICKFQ